MNDNLIKQLIAERDRIDQVIKLLSGDGTQGGAPAKKRGRRKMSKEARARIAAAQKKRWAEARAKRK